MSLVDLENKIKYGAFSEITGDKPMLVCEDEDKVMSFCYSQNKNLPEDIMTLSPLYCFIRKVEVNAKGDVIRIIKPEWKSKKIKKVEEE